MTDYGQIIRDFREGVEDAWRNQRPIVPRHEYGTQAAWDEITRLGKLYAQAYQPAGSDRIYVDAESAEKYRLAARCADVTAYFWLGREAEAA